MEIPLKRVIKSSEEKKIKVYLILRNTFFSSIDLNPTKISESRFSAVFKITKITQNTK